MSNQERLENISPIGFDNDGNYLIKHEDYFWLQEQAERFEILAEQHDKTLAENQRYKQALEEIKAEETVTTALSNGQVAYTRSGHIARKALEDDTP